MNFKQKSELKDPRISTFLLDSSSTKMHQILEESEVNIEPKDSKDQSSIMLPNFENGNHYMFSMKNNNYLNEKNISEFVHSFNNNNELNNFNVDSKNKDDCVYENLFKENIASSNFIDSSKNNEQSFEENFGPIKKNSQDLFVEENQQFFLENISKENIWNESLKSQNQDIVEKKDKNQKIITEKEDSIQEIIENEDSIQLIIENAEKKSGN